MTYENKSPRFSFGVCVLGAMGGLVLIGGSSLSWGITPSDLLPNGQDSREMVDSKTGKRVSVRKATNKAMIDNAHRFGQLVTLADSLEKEREISQIIHVLTTLIEPLSVGGTFDLFEPLEWMSNPCQEGRVLTAILYLRHYPQRMSPQITEVLKGFLSTVSRELAKEISYCLEQKPLEIEESKKLVSVASSALTPEKLLLSQENGATMIDPLTGEKIFVRKGTIAALRVNIKELNHLLREAPSEEVHQKIEILLQTNQSLLPSLRALGLFELFPLEEWLQTEKQPGRLLIPILMLQLYPQLMTPTLRTCLDKLKGVSSLRVRQEIGKI